jgi:hypothetical protein
MRRHAAGIQSSHGWFFKNPEYVGRKGIPPDYRKL